MMKGQKFKFDEFGLILIGAVIFMGILAIGFTTPSEFPPKVSTLEVKLNLDPGSYETFTFNITGKASGVNITFAGEIAEWMSTPVRDYGAISRTTPVAVTVTVPGIMSAGTYTGKVLVSGKEGVTEIDVSVTVSAVKRLESKTYPIGDFRVAYLDGSRTLDSSKSNYVSKSYLYEKSLNLVGVLEDQEVPIATGGAVKFVVEDANNYGPVVVLQNGREIFNEVVGPGEVIVPLNRSDIRKSTTVTIRADNPGLFFWAENVYSIRDASLDVSYSGSVEKAFNFTLLPDQYRKVDHVQIVYNVDSSSSPLPEMRIQLNGNTIFFDSPPVGSFNRNIARDVFGSPLTLQEKNSLRFSFDREADYRVSDATMIVYSRAQ